jgi:amino acid transporter
VIFFWVVGFLWKRKAWLRTKDMDVDTGRRALDWDYINSERERMAHWPAWRKALNKIF